MPIQAIVQSSLEAVEFIDTPIPIPKSKEVVIKVVVSGTNPKDWKMPLWKGRSYNSGDDIAGIVHSVGQHVYEFNPGDRVAALHEFFTDNGSFAEYAVALDWTTFHIPPNVTFEDAATIPVAALTAALSLYIDMKLPTPWNPWPENEEKMPLLIYGVTSAVGAFAAKYARLSGLSPIIGVAGRSSDFAKSLVDYVVDYRKGEDAIIADVEDILAKEGLGKIRNVFDAISENGSLEATLRFIDLNDSTVSTMLPPKLFARDGKNFEYPKGVRAVNSAAPQLYSTHKDFAYLWSRYLGRLLEDGRLKAHPYEIIPGGLNGILIGLRKLKNGEASATKYIYKVEDTGNVTVTPVESSQATRGKVPEELQSFPFP